MLFRVRYLNGFWDNPQNLYEAVNMSLYHLISLWFDPHYPHKFQLEIKMCVLCCHILVKFFPCNIGFEISKHILKTTIFFPFSFTCFPNRILALDDLEKANICSIQVHPSFIRTLMEGWSSSPFKQRYDFVENKVLAQVSDTEPKP